MERTPEALTLSGLLVIHKSINVQDVLVILVGSEIICERLYISKTFKRSVALEFGVFDNRLQFKSPRKYNSKFSTSILSIISSNKVIECLNGV